jgi:hypothetical protein
MKLNLLSAVTCVALGFTTSSGFAQTKATAKSAAPLHCFISEFKQLALSVHDPVLRTKELMHWLGKHVTSCTVEQLVMINSNKSSWLGTADTTKMASVIESMIEFKVAGKPEMLNQIFGTMSNERTESAQVISAGPQMRLPPVAVVDINGQQQLFQQLPILQNYTQQQNLPNTTPVPSNPPRQ